MTLIRLIINVMIVNNYRIFDIINVDANIEYDIEYF